MAADQFADRFAQVRARFAARLGGRVDALDSSLPHLTGEGAAVLDALATAHRDAHDLCGIGPTIGFYATGRAARQVEQLLLEALRAGRGLTDNEAGNLRREIVALRAAARADLQTNKLDAE